MSYELKESNEGFAIFTIKRKDKRNAVNFEVMEGLESALEEVECSSHRGFVISGEGNDAFCSGGDLSIFQKLKTEKEAFEMLSRMAGILYRLFMFPKPTVALVNGIALGGGCEIATACDFRIAHRAARAGFVQGSLAITTGWGGGTMLLERLSQSHSLQMLMKAKVYEMEELLRLGFIDFVYEGSHQEGLHNGLRELVSLEPDVLQAYKQILLEKRDKVALKNQIDKEVRQCAKLWEKDIHHEIVKRFINKKQM